MMVQRVLAARTISHARGGTLLAGYLKVLPLFMIIIPGMISRTLYPDVVACNQPSICESICHSKRSCTNPHSEQAWIGISRSTPWELWRWACIARSAGFGR